MTGRRYNLKPTPREHELYARPYYHDIRARLLRAPMVVPPNLVDWSAGRAPIRDQGQEGDCAGHQCRNVRCLAHWFVAGKQPDNDYSVAYPYWQGRVIEGTQTQDSGMTIGDALLGMENTGISEERFMPYVVGGYATPPSEEAIQNALTHKLDLQAVPVDFTDLKNLHDVLADRHPIIFGFDVPPSFEQCGDNGEIPDPAGEDGLGGHAGSTDQINLADGWFADVNSWGTSWGKQGVGFMPKSYLSRFFECWAIVPVL